MAAIMAFMLTTALLADDTPGVEAKVKGLFPTAEPSRQSAPDDIAGVTEQVRPASHGATRRHPARPPSRPAWPAQDGGATRTA